MRAAHSLHPHHLCNWVVSPLQKAVRAWPVFNHAPCRGTECRRSSSLVQASHKQSSTMPHQLDSQLLDKLQEVVPELSGTNHKGQHGKVGVLGGCREYTGAPYFSAISAMKESTVGVDLSHVFCTNGAATVIKTYSPELIVLPYLPDSSDAEQHQEQHMQELIATWLKKMQCLVIGPGLGDDPMVVATSKHMLQQAREMNLPILVDGSGLNFVAKEPALVSGYKRCILTPNLAEFGRLAQGVGLELPGSISPKWQAHTQSLAAAFGGVTVLSKGPKDTISDGDSTMQIDLPAGLKRAGGQGDVLTGATAAFMCWGELHAKNNGRDLGMNPMVLASCGGSAITRRASCAAFEAKGRALLAGDVVDHLHQAFLHFFKE